MKGAGFSDGLLAPRGYAIAEDERGSNCRFRMGLRRTEGWPVAEFVFGFNGVGRHYRLQLDYERQLVTLFAIRDGQPVYLHHVRHRLRERIVLSLIWVGPSIRVKIGSQCVLNVWDDTYSGGRWGFRAPDRAVRLPKVSVQQIAQIEYKWVIFGDGFSNPRWNNKDYLCWPDMVFRRTSDWFNFCVSACNSDRGLEVIAASHLPQGGTENVIIAFGNDDLIEQRSRTRYLNNLSQAVELLQVARRLFVVSLWPGIAPSESIEAWNASLKQAGERLKKVEYLDLYTALSGELGLQDFTGPEAQVRIARFIAAKLGLESSLDVGVQVGSPSAIQRVYRRFLLKMKFLCEKHSHWVGQ